MEPLVPPGRGAPTNYGLPPQLRPPRAATGKAGGWVPPAEAPWGLREWERSRPGLADAGREASRYLRAGG